MNNPGPCKDCGRVAVNGVQCIECWAEENNPLNREGFLDGLMAELMEKKDEK